MRKLFFFALIAISLSACSARRKTVRPNYPSTAKAPVASRSDYDRNNDRIKQAHQQPAGGYVNYTALTYIDRFKAIAIQEMNLYGIPASITLAQGLIESSNGNGDLARYANNHFGIKCTSDWKGEGFYKDDDQANDCFRVYANPEESFRDHSEFLKRKRYAHLFELDKNDYQGWAQGLKDAGYATNPKYPQLLINLIQKYSLDAFDRPENEIQKIKREDRVLSQINNNIGKVKDSVVVDIPLEKRLYKAPAKTYTPPAASTTPPATSTTPVPASKTYTVITGDTLYSISKRFGIAIEDLKALNNMADNNIKIGQLLIIAR